MIHSRYAVGVDASIRPYNAVCRIISAFRRFAHIHPALGVAHFFQFRQGQLYGTVVVAGGDLRLDHMVQAAFAFQILLCFFQRHNTSIHFAKNAFPVPIISPFAANEKQVAEKIR